MHILQTKLNAAIAIAAEGKSVAIVRCGTLSAGQAIRNDYIDRGTLILPVNNDS